MANPDATFSQIENGFGCIENLMQQQLELSRQQRETMERGFSSLEALIRQQHETTQMQARHIERLMGVVKTLLQRAA